ncbi:MAG: gamma carbonic anhydrase family protein [candidate division WOR-3 bacterium]
MGLILPYKGKYPRFGQYVYVAPTAQVIGDVVVGDYSSIWFGAVLRGDVEEILIGQYTNIQDNVVLHGTRGKYNVVVGDYVTIGHNACVHGARVSSHVLIGIGAVLLDGVEVGEYSIIGAGAVVAPGTKIEPGSLVLGVPGKVVRRLTEEEKASIDRNARNYLEYAGEYMSEIDKT